RAHVGFHVLGAVAAAVDGGAFHAHHGAGGVFDASVEQVGEVIPHLILGRVAGQFDVFDGPAGHASTPADDVHGEAVVLRVDARGDGEHAARGGAQCIRFRAIGEDVVLDLAHGRVFPRLGEAIVDEGLEPGRVVLRAAPHGDQIEPARAQPDRVI